MSTAAVDIKRIHIAKSALGMDEDTYRAVIQRISRGRTDSSKELTDAERAAVMKHMRACGFTPRSPKQQGAAIITRPEMTKLRAMWWRLSEQAAVTRPGGPAACDEAIAAWAERQLSTDSPPLQHIRFATPEQWQRLVESMKKWVNRVARQAKQVKQATP